VWWWPRIPPAKRRAQWASRGQASSTSSSSPPCRSRPSPLPTSSSCIYIAAPLSLLSQTRIESKTLTGGALTRPGVRNAGKSLRNGSPNLRLALGQQLELAPLRVTEFAPAIPPHSEQAATRPASAATSAPIAGYGPPPTASSFKTGRFTGTDLPLQPDGTLRCPAANRLRPQERRREADGSLRVVYAASIRSCRPCSLREQCQWNGNATAKPRQVSVLLHPLQVGAAPLLWREWSRREHRRAWLRLVRHQRVEVGIAPPLPAASPTNAEVILSRAQRAHSRLSWETRVSTAARQVTIKLFGVPEPFAEWIGLTHA